MKIGFAGLSHLGLCTAVATATKGFEVVGFDPDSSLIQDLNSGKLPVHEPDLEELFQKHASQMKWASELGELSTCDLVYLSKDVPTDSENQSDLGAIAELLDQLVPALAPTTILVILCQVTPGFTRQIAERYPQLTLYYQVETLIFGRAMERATQPERFIVGCPSSVQSSGGYSLPEPLSEYLAAFDCPILPMGFESAELCKISINFCLVASVTVANTLAEVCESIGANWSEIVPALKLDKRIGQYAYLAPGLGISGGNLERDLATIQKISAEKGTHSEVVSAWQSSSQYRKQWPFRVLKKEVLDPNDLKLSEVRIGVWGIAYKQDTHSIKNSPAIEFLEQISSGDVLPQVRAYDPEARLPRHLEEKGIQQVVTAQEAAEEADILLVLTPWKEFTDSTLFENFSGKAVIDPYGLIQDKGRKKVYHFQLGQKETKESEQC